MTHSVDDLLLSKKSSTASVASAAAGLTFPDLPPQIVYETDYDIASCNPTMVLDLHSPGFHVTHVNAADVIHAKLSDVPSILKVSNTPVLFQAPRNAIGFINRLVFTSITLHRWPICVSCRRGIRNHVLASLRCIRDPATYCVSSVALVSDDMNARRKRVYSISLGG